MFGDQQGRISEANFYSKKKEAPPSQVFVLFVLGERGVVVTADFGSLSKCDLNI